MFTLLYLDLNEAYEEETCENCNLTKPKTQILIHIGETEACKTHYGPRFEAMKAQNETEQKQKSRQSKKARGKKRNMIVMPILKKTKNQHCRVSNAV